MEKKTGLRESLRMSLRAVRLVRKYCPGLLLSQTLASVFEAVTPYAAVFFSARIIDELAGMRRADVLWRLVALTVAVTGALALAGYLLARWRDTKSGWDAVFYKGFARIFEDKQFELDYEDIESREVRDLYSQIRENMNWGGHGITAVPRMVQDGVRGVVGVIGAVALVAGLFLSRVPASAGALTALDSPLALLALAAALVIPTALSPLLEGAAGRMTQTAAMAENARFGNRAFMYFGFVPMESERALDVRLYRQCRIVNKYSDYVEKYAGFASFNKLAKGKQGVLYAVSACMPVLLTGAVYVYVCLKAWAGAFGVGMVTQYVSAVTALATSAMLVLRQAAEIRTNAPFLKLAFDYLDRERRMYRGSLTTEKRSDRQYEVEFRDVSFRYPNTDRWALRHVSVKFRVGTRLAIVGENGSGKSTFVKLLCRLYDPQEGEILLNGIDIRKYDYDDYMAVFSMVFQDFTLLSRPLGENVAGGLRYDRERVTKSLEDAGFGERLAELPQGLYTMLYRDFGEDGVEPSGGEAQKIAIARALCKDAPFIVLDEPTAALDPIAEAEIYRQFDSISGDRTAIYISHRLSSCRFCDEILVFEDGGIAERGTHDGLLARGGKYAELWNAQAQYYE